MSNFQDLLEKIKKINNIDFNEMQKEALNENNCNNNIVVSSPTTSGKTIVAETYLLNTILNKKKRAIFVSPLKALTSEHYNGFKKKYEKELDLKIGISTGDLDSSSKYLENYQILFLTFEKLDSLIRHKVSWLHTIGLIVIDEIHNLDTDRGAILETTIVELMQIIKNIQIIGLSATIPNANEIAKWLNAKLIYSEYRPVILKKGVIYEDNLIFENENKKIDFKNNSLESLIIDTLKKQKQAIIFANTRKNAESIAKKIALITKKYLLESDNKKILKEYEDIENYLITDYDKEIFNIIKQGSSYHHAGLREQLRNVIEKLFKNKIIKIIVATPTLAVGVNLPAFRTIITTIYRHTENGLRPIPVKEYLQMAGRAGRMGFDEYGESLIIAKDEMDAENLKLNYIYAEPEEINSMLGFIPVLRTMLLSLIANEIIYNNESLENFFKNTFYALKFGDLNALLYKIETILRELKSFGFIEIYSDSVKTTEMGKRISELYIDPLSAKNIIDKLNNFEDFTEKEFIMTLINTMELRPYFGINKNKLENLEIDLQENYKNFGLTTNDLYEDIDILQKYYSSLIFLEWINEISEQELLDNYNLLPGTLHNKLFKAEWIAYAIGEIAKILKKEIIYKKSKNFEKRIKNGIKEELLLLIELPNIGRARARRLYNSGYKSIADIKNAEPQMLINILGLKIAQKLLEHLKVEFDINSIFIKQESNSEQKILKKDESKASKKITKKKIKTQAKLQKNLFDY